MRDIVSVKVKTDFATKSDLKKLEKKIDNGFSTIDGRFGEIDGKFGEVDDKFKKLENKILESEERILTELQKMRENDEAHQFSHIRINEEIEELQKKVGVI